MLKKFVAAAAAVVVAATAWHLFVRPPADGVGATEAASVVEPVRAGPSEPRSDDDTDRGLGAGTSTEPGPTRVALAVATQPHGALVVTVRGHDFRREEEEFLEIAEPAPGSGVPVPGVWIELRGKAVEGPFGIAAADTGKVRVDALPPGNVGVRAPDGGPFAHAAVDVLPDATAEVEVFVELLGTLTGLVVDPEGHPVPGAELWVGRQGRNPQPLRRLRRGARADDAGRFVLPFLPGEDHVSASAPGFAASPSYALHLRTAADVVLRLSRDAGEVVGFVVDDLGQPVAQAVIAVDALDDALHRDVDGRVLGPRVGALARSDERGAFVVPGLAAGAYVVHASRLPNASAELRVRVAQHQRHDVRLVLPRGVLVRGRVLRPVGAACGGVHVGCVDPGGTWINARTESDGTFRIDGAPVVPLTFVARRLGSVREARLATPAATTAQLDVELVLDDAPRVFGYVRASNGMPLAGFVVAPDAAAGGRSAVVQENGWFEWCDATPGRQRVTVSAPVVGAPFVGKSGGAVVLRAEVQADVATELRVLLDDVPFAEVRGRVLAGGQPRDDLLLECTGAGLFEGADDGSGGFRIGRILPGRRALQLFVPGHEVRRWSLELQPGQQLDLGDVTLAPVGSLRVTWQSSDGRPWQQPWPEVWPRAADGRVLRAAEGVSFRRDGDTLVIGGLVPGPYTFAVDPRDPVHVEVSSVDVVAGAETAVALKLAPGQRHELRFEGIAASSALVRVRGAGGGEVVCEDTLRLEDGRGAWQVVLPVGEFVAEAVLTGSGPALVVARRELSSKLVGASPIVVDVPSTR